MADIEQILKDGIAAARSGDRTTGRKLLEQVIDADPHNEVAWMWLTSCVTTASERRECLEQVLQINPDNERAQQALKKLGGSIPQPAASSQNQDMIDRLREESRGKTSSASRKKARDDKNRGGRSRVMPLLLFVLLIAALAVIAMIVVPELTSTDETPTPTVVAQVDVSPTARSGAAFVPTQRPGVMAQPPTLPATFTPTTTPTPTATFTPTATPIPLSIYRALLVSSKIGDEQPTLYEMDGEGQNMAALGEGFGDIALNPIGDTLAFVRSVRYAAEAEGGEPVFYPELFVAPLDNLNQAQQITEMRSDHLSGPTWSPDGMALVFVSDSDGDQELWYVSNSGENLVKITANDYIDRDPAWSPIADSRTILFASDRTSFGSTEIFSMELTDGFTESAVRRLTNDNRGSYSPAWSFDGTLITFASDRSGDGDIYVMRTDGRTQKLLTTNDGDAEDLSPSFTSDNRYIAFISNREDDRFQAYLVSVEGDVLTRMTTTEGNNLMVVYIP